MRSLLLSLVAFCLAFTPSIRAEDARTAALTAADDARVAATKSADREKLTAIFSDELRYAHSSGTVDTKQSYNESLTSGRTKYLTLDYEEDYWLLRTVLRILGPRATRKDIEKLFLKNPQLSLVNWFRNDEWKRGQEHKRV